VQSTMIPVVLPMQNQLPKTMPASVNSDSGVVVPLESNRIPSLLAMRGFMDILTVPVEGWPGKKAILVWLAGRNSWIELPICTL
jgi:hypothetical protein